MPFANLVGIAKGAVQIKALQDRIDRANRLLTDARNECEQVAYERGAGFKNVVNKELHILAGTKSDNHVSP